MTNYVQMLFVACLATGTPHSTPANFHGGTNSSPRHERAGSSSGRSNQFRRNSRENPHHSPQGTTPSSPSLGLNTHERGVGSTDGSGLWRATGRDDRLTSAATVLPSAAVTSPAEPVFWSLPSSPVFEGQKQNQQQQHHQLNGHGSCPSPVSLSADVACFGSDDLRSSMAGDARMGTDIGGNSPLGVRRGPVDILGGSIVGTAAGFADRSCLFGARHRCDNEERSIAGKWSDAGTPQQLVFAHGYIKRQVCNRE